MGAVDATPLLEATNDLPPCVFHPLGSLAGTTSAWTSSGAFPSQCKPKPAFAFSIGASPSRRATTGARSGTSEASGDRGCAELALASRSDTSLPRQTTPAKEASERLDGRPDLPSEEEGLKSNHSGRSSAVESGVQNGENGAARGLRVGEGLLSLISSTFASSHHTCGIIFYTDPGTKVLTTQLYNNSAL
jgi:hypothetical protein